MKYSAVAVAAFVALASAQDLSAIPECSHECILDAIAGTTCGTDLKCVCEGQEALIQSAAMCVVDACTGPVAIDEVLPAVDALCKEILAAPAPEPTEAEPTPEPTETEEPTPEPTEDEEEEEEEEEETPVESAPSSIITPAPTPVPSGNGTIPAPPASSSPIYTAGAAAVGYIGSAAMLALGAIAAL